MQDAEIVSDALHISTEKAMDILGALGGLRGLMSPDKSLDEIPGISKGLKVRIVAFRELERRHLKEDLLKKSVVCDPESVVSYLYGTMRDRAIEVFTVLFLNKANAVITSEEMFIGTIDQTAVHPREVLKACLKHNASAIIIAHNHPSGRTEPSPEDRILTGRLQSACSLIGIRILDHVIIGDNSHYSFKENRLL